MRSTIIAATLLLIGTVNSAVAQDPLSMRSAAPGSTAHQMSVAITSSVNQAQRSYDILLGASGTTSADLVELAQGEYDYGLSSPTLFRHLSAQTGMYQSIDNASALANNLGLMFWFPAGPLHVMTYADSNINVLDDLRDKSVFLGPAGSEAFYVNRNWLRALTGMEAGKDYTPVNDSWTGGFQKFFTGAADAYFIGGIEPIIQISQASSRGQIRLLGLSERETQVAVQAVDGYVDLVGAEGRQPASIDIQNYGDMVVNTENVFTFSSLIGVVARRDLSEDAVYDFVKGFWEDWETGGGSSGITSNMTKEIAMNDTSMPLHPGALKYYSVSGWTIPEALQAQ